MDYCISTTERAGESLIVLDVEDETFVLTREAARELLHRLEHDSEAAS